MPDNKDPHLAKIDPGQLVQRLPGYDLVTFLLSSASCILKMSVITEAGCKVSRYGLYECYLDRYLLPDL